MAQVRRQLARYRRCRWWPTTSWGCIELGAIHLSQSPPQFAEATLAIDAWRP